MSFLIHTKHSCDICCKKPIVGRQCTSGVANIDVCSRCCDTVGKEDSLALTWSLKNQDGVMAKTAAAVTYKQIIPNKWEE